MEPKNYIEFCLDERIKKFTELRRDKNLSSRIIRSVELICQAYRKQKKVLFFGNGGSASQAEHFAAELIGRFRKEREPLKAIALTANTAVLTAVGNDYNFEQIFSRQLEALADEGDIAIGISTSGNSPNVIVGIKAAKRRRAKTIGLTGGKKNELENLADINIAVPSDSTPEIQEGHLFIGHLICDLVEQTIFG